MLRSAKEDVLKQPSSGFAGASPSRAAFKNKTGQDPWAGNIAPPRLRGPSASFDGQRPATAAGDPSHGTAVARSSPLPAIHHSVVSRPQRQATRATTAAADASRSKFSGRTSGLSARKGAASEISISTGLDHLAFALRRGKKGLGTEPSEFDLPSRPQTNVGFVHGEIQERQGAIHSQNRVPGSATVHAHVPTVRPSTSAAQHIVNHSDAQYLDDSEEWKKPRSRSVLGLADPESDINTIGTHGGVGHQAYSPPPTSPTGYVGEHTLPTTGMGQPWSPAGIFESETPAMRMKREQGVQFNLARQAALGMGAAGWDSWQAGPFVPANLTMTGFEDVEKFTSDGRPQSLLKNELKNLIDTRIGLSADSKIADGRRSTHASDADELCSTVARELDLFQRRSGTKWMQQAEADSKKRRQWSAAMVTDSKDAETVVLEPLDVLNTFHLTTSQSLPGDPVALEIMRSFSKETVELLELFAAMGIRLRCRFSSSESETDNEMRGRHLVNVKHVIHDPAMASALCAAAVESMKRTPAQSDEAHRARKTGLMSSEKGILGYSVYLEMSDQTYEALAKKARASHQQLKSYVDGIRRLNKSVSGIARAHLSVDVVDGNGSADQNIDEDLSFNADSKTVSSPTRVFQRMMTMSGSPGSPEKNSWLTMGADATTSSKFLSESEQLEIKEMSAFADSLSDYGFTRKKLRQDRAPTSPATDQLSANDKGVSKVSADEEDDVFWREAFSTLMPAPSFYAAGGKPSTPETPDLTVSHMRYKLSSLNGYDASEGTLGEEMAAVLAGALNMFSKGKRGVGSSEERAARIARMEAELKELGPEGSKAQNRRAVQALLEESGFEGGLTGLVKDALKLMDNIEDGAKNNAFSLEAGQNLARELRNPLALLAPDWESEQAKAGIREAPDWSNTGKFLMDNDKQLFDL